MTTERITAHDDGVLRDLFEDQACDSPRLNQFEQALLTDILDQWEEHGSFLRLSVKQLAIIDRITEKFYAT